MSSHSAGNGRSALTFPSPLLRSKQSGNCSWPSGFLAPPAPKGRSSTPRAFEIFGQRRPQISSEYETRLARSRAQLVLPQEVPAGSPRPRTADIKRSVNSRGNASGKDPIAQESNRLLRTFRSQVPCCRDAGHYTEQHASENCRLHHAPRVERLTGSRPQRGERCHTIFSISSGIRREKHGIWSWRSTCRFQ